jgi:hypothetical protein
LVEVKCIVWQENVILPHKNLINALYNGWRATMMVASHSPPCWSSRRRWPCMRGWRLGCGGGKWIGKGSDFQSNPWMVWRFQDSSHVPYIELTGGTASDDSEEASIFRLIKNRGKNKKKDDILLNKFSM